MRFDVFLVSPCYQTAVQSSDIEFSHSHNKYDVIMYTNISSICKTIIIHFDKIGRTDRAVIIGTRIKLLRKFRLVHALFVPGGQNSMERFIETIFRKINQQMPNDPFQRRPQTIRLSVGGRSPRDSISQCQCRAL